MKTRIALLAATLVAALGISASVATADVCACGGEYPRINSVSGPFSNGQCMVLWDDGPGASPRYRAVLGSCP